MEGRIVIAGGLGLDIIPMLPNDRKKNRENWISPGGTLELDRIAYYIGGQTGNTGRVLKRLGANVLIQSIIGSDIHGRVIQQILEREGIHNKLAVSNGNKTSCTIVLAPPGKDRMFLYCRGASQSFKAQDVDLHLLENADFFHFGYPPTMENMYCSQGEELIYLMSSAKERGVTTSMDMCMPDINSAAGQVEWREILKNTLPYIDIFVPSIEEIFFMLDKKSYMDQKDKRKDFIDTVCLDQIEETADMLLSMGSNIVMLKCGYKGLYLKTRDLHNNIDTGRGLSAIRDVWSEKTIYTPPYPVKSLICTNGSGDAAVAGLLSAMSKGRSPEMAVKISAAVAAKSIMSYDVAEHVCLFDELEKNIKYENVYKEK